MISLLIIQRLPIHFYGPNSSTPHSPPDLNVIRACLDCLDFITVNGEYSEIMGNLWRFYCFSAYRESDEFYNIVESDEGETIHPRKSSVCQLVLDVLGSNIRENLIYGRIERLWSFSNSLLFLKWFMASTNSEALTIHRDTGWSPIAFMMYRLPYHSFRDPDLDPGVAKDKVKFLANKGASLHHVTKIESPTARAMRSCCSFYLWCEILEELGIDFESFVEEEIGQGFLQKEGWSKTTLMDLFRDSIHRNLLQKSNLQKSNEDEFWWDAYNRCSSCGSPTQTFWELYLEHYKNAYVLDIGNNNASDDREVSDEDEDKVSGDDDEVRDDEKLSMAQ